MGRDESVAIGGATAQLISQIKVIITDNIQTTVITSAERVSGVRSAKRVPRLRFAP